MQSPMSNHNSFSGHGISQETSIDQPREMFWFVEGRSGRRSVADVLCSQRANRGHGCLCRKALQLRLRGYAWKCFQVPTHGLLGFRIMKSDHCGVLSQLAVPLLLNWAKTPCQNQRPPTRPPQPAPPRGAEVNDLGPLFDAMLHTAVWQVWENF